MEIGLVGVSSLRRGLSGILAACFGIGGVLGVGRICVVGDVGRIRWISQKKNWTAMGPSGVFGRDAKAANSSTIWRLWSTPGVFGSLDSRSATMSKTRAGC